MSTDLTQTLLYDKALGCLLGGLIGDAMGTPTEGKDYRDIERTLGWVDDFSCDGTDDTIMRNLLAEALIRTDGYATLDDWASVWLDHWDDIFGSKVGKFFISVLHTAQKIRRHSTPRMAALGNMPSSSSAMGIAPVGIVNAGNPRQAALQAYSLAGLIHTHDVAFCQDGAAAIAAAVAHAFDPAATVATILQAARQAIVPRSGAEMLGRIAAALELAADAEDYRAFRATLYEQADRFFFPIMCDARETAPLALALFQLAEGDVGLSVIYAANLGRDADTLGAMAGAIAGAYRGARAMPQSWRDKVAASASLDQGALAEELAHVALRKLESERRAGAVLDRLVGL